MRFALTFDDGPGDWTPAILDLLAAHAARASFFVLGQSIAGREHTVRRAHAEGHELGNHTWSHRRVWRLSDGELRAELERTSAAIDAAAGVRPALARAPYGSDPRRFARVAAEAGLTAVLWTIDPFDWREPPAEAIVRRVLARLHDGAIVDLHDGWRHGSRRATSQPTVEALALLLPELAARGYRCVTVSELPAR